MSTRKEGAGARVQDRRKWLLDHCEEVGECLIWKGIVAGGGYPAGYIDGEKRMLRAYAHTVIYGRLMPPGCRASVTCGNRLCLGEKCVIAKRVSTVVRDMHAVCRRDPMAYEQRRISAHVAGHAKLDMARALEIRASDESTADLAKRYGVTA